MNSADKSSHRLLLFGPFELDQRRRVLSRDGEALPLTAKALDILLVLAHGRDRIISRDEIMAEVWPETVVEEGNLTQHISVLRRSLGEKVGENLYIATVPGRGYRFVATIEHPTEESTLPRGTHSSAFQNSASQHGASQNSATQNHASDNNAHIWKWIALGAVAILLVTAVPRFLPEPEGSSLAARLSDGNLPVQIAVLPFDTGDPEANELGVAIADGIIQDLSGTEGLAVKPTGAVLEFSDPRDDTPIEAGEQLGVHAVLAGRVHRDGTLARSTVQLIRIRDGSSLWSVTTEGRFTSDLAMRDAMTHEVAAALSSAQEMPGDSARP